MMRAAAILISVIVSLSRAVPSEAGGRLVHLVNIGWHTGIAIRSVDIDPALIPEVADLPGTGWIEFGWGDAAFYRDPDPAIASYFSAAYIATPAVMHLVGMPAPPVRYFPSAEIIDVPLDPGGFDRLIAFISASFARARASGCRRWGRASTARANSTKPWATSRCPTPATPGWRKPWPKPGWKSTPISAEPAR